MQAMKSTLSDRQAVWAFVLGCLAVTAGVAAHLPTFAMAQSMHYHLAGMPMDTMMVAGMALIVLGTLVAAYGLLPRDVAARRAAAAGIVIAAPEDAPLRPAHWGLMAVLVIALVIDVMKPASLGFTVPGMISEYGVPRRQCRWCRSSRWPVR
jgi:putative MFS transporter